MLFVMTFQNICTSVRVSPVLSHLEHCSLSIDIVIESGIHIRIQKPTAHWNITNAKCQHQRKLVPLEALHHFLHAFNSRHFCGIWVYVCVWVFLSGLNVSMSHTLVLHLLNLFSTFMLILFAFSIYRDSQTSINLSMNSGDFSINETINQRQLIDIHSRSDNAMASVFIQRTIVFLSNKQ